MKWRERFAVTWTLAARCERPGHFKMERRVITRAKTVTAAILAVVIPAGLWWLYVHGERLSDRWLRVGGRVVQFAIQRPNRTVAVFLAVVVLMWIIVGLRCLWESWQERRRLGRAPEISATTGRGKT